MHVWYDMINFVMQVKHYVLVMIGYLLTNFNNDFVIDVCFTIWVNWFKKLHDPCLVNNKVNWSIKYIFAMLFLTKVYVALFCFMCRIISMKLCMIQVSFYDIFFVGLLPMLFKFKHINFIWVILFSHMFILPKVIVMY